MSLLTSLLSSVGGGGTSFFLQPATAATIANLDVIYNNGADGVGATIINDGALGQITIDDVALIVGDRFVLKNQDNDYENGVYEVTVEGDVSTPYEAVRTIDFDSSTEMEPGTSVYIIYGTVNIQTTWILQSIVTTVGTDAIIFSANAFGGFTANRALISDSVGKADTSSTTSTEIAYVSGVTSAIQTQLDSKINQSGSQIYAADSGSTDTYVITLNPAPSSYTVGMVINFKANTANTGPATLNVNGLGAIPIVKNHDEALINGNIEAGQIVTVIYDGTNFQTQSQQVNPLLTANRAVVSDGSGLLTAATTTATEIGYVNGVTSAIQTQFTNKISQSGAQIYGADAGATDAYAITLSPAPLAYAEGMAVYVKFNTANTGSASLNVNSLGAVVIKKNNDQDLVDGDITEGLVSALIYDGTNFQIQSTLLGSMAIQSAADVNITGGAIDGVTIDSATISGGTIDSATLDTCTINDATISGGTIDSAAITGGTIAGLTEFDCDNWTINDNFIQGVYTASELQVLLSSTGGAQDIARLETTDSGTKGRLYLTDTTATNTLIATTNDLTVNGITRLSPLVTTAGGPTNAYTVTLSPTPSAYYLGMTITFRANGQNSGAATLNVNSLGAQSIKKFSDVDLGAGDIEGGQFVTVVYESTYFQMVSPTAKHTGSGGYVLETAPTISGLLVNTINKVTITAPATAATLTLANNSTLVTSGAFSTTLASTNTTSVTLPTSGTLLSTAAAVTVAQGGTGQTTYTNGQLLIGNTTGNTLAKGTLTGTANQINVTNGAGSITLALSSTPVVPTLTVQNGTSANTALYITSGTYTSYPYTSTIYLQAGFGDNSYYYQTYIRCLNLGGGGASNAKLTMGITRQSTGEQEVLRLDQTGISITGAISATGNIQAATFNGITIGSANVIGKNLLINGNCQVSQSGTSFAVPASTNKYTSDMWEIKTNANQAYTVTNLTGIGGLVVRRNSGQTGTGQVLFGQSLVRDACYSAISNYVTFSFECLRGSNYSHAGNFLDVFILWSTAGSDTSGIDGTWTGSSEGFSVPLTTSLVRHSVTLSSQLPSNVRQIAVYFGMTPIGTAGADDSFRVANLKLEVGNAYTGYVQESYAETLRSVLPYHYRIRQNTNAYFASVYGFAISGGTVAMGAGGISFPAQMRAIPTVTYDTASNFSIEQAAAGDGLNASVLSAITTLNVTVDTLKFSVVMNPSTALAKGYMGILKTDGSASFAFIDFDAYLT